MKYVSQRSEDTKKVAEDFINSLKPREGATVVALNGDLGAGKTTFSQFIGRALGVTENIPSPTFLIERVYELKAKPWTHFVHIDAYRLEREEELLALGFAEMLEKPENLIFIEWAERVKNILPNSAIHIDINHVDETTREIQISTP
jgi:ATPase, YjeE family